MGYTHYWHRPAVLPKAKWKNFVQEVLMLKDNLPKKGITAGNGYGKSKLEIAGWNPKGGEGNSGEYELGFPIMDGEQMAYNGAGDGLDHESLVIERALSKEEIRGAKEMRPKAQLISGFCKTARKPYDTFVCLTLISFKRWFGNTVEIGTDGDREDWQPAIDLYQKLTSAPITYGMIMHEIKANQDK